MPIVSKNQVKYGAITGAFSAAIVYFKDSMPAAIRDYIPCSRVDAMKIGVLAFSASLVGAVAKSKLM